MAEPLDLAKLERLARQAMQGTTGEWAWDDGDLVELDHEEPVGIQVSQARGSPVAPHIAAADPAMVLALVAELRGTRRVMEAARHHWRTNRDGCAICRAMSAHVAQTRSNTDSRYAR